MCLASVPTLSTIGVIYVLRSTYHVTGHHSDNCVCVTLTVHVEGRDDVNIDVHIDADVCNSSRNRRVGDRVRFLTIYYNSLELLSLYDDMMIC